MRHPIHRGIALLVLTALVTGCASAPDRTRRAASERPLWVDDPGREYPEELYIAASAGGDTGEAARRNAAARVAMVFEADIDASETLAEAYFETESGGHDTFSRTSSLKKDLKVTTRQTLRNLVVPKTWQDPETRRYHALAYLDRDEAGAIYSAELDRLDRDVGVYHAGYRTADEKLMKLAYLDKALSLAAERDMLAGQLSIIRRGADTYSPANSRSDLLAARADLRGRLGLQAAFSHPERRAFNTAVLDVLESFGFRIVDHGGDYRLDGGLSMQKLEREGVFVGWHAELHLVGWDDGAEILTLGEGGREGHVSYPEAERRAEREAVKVVRTKLEEELTGYLSTLLTAD